MLVKAAYVREDIIMSHRIINPYHTWRNKWDWLKGMPPWWSMVTLLSGWHILFQVTTTHLKIGYPCARTSVCLPMSSFVYRLHHTRVHIKVLCLSFWSWWYQTIISSAASKVIEAYPMPSRQSSVHLSGVSLFTSWYRLPQFYPIFLIFGLNVHNAIAQKVMELKFWNFFAYISNGSLILKYMLKLGISEVFGRFAMVASYGNMKCVLQAYCVYFQVTEKNVPVDQISGSF